jgi:hypothetical protein
VSSHNSVYVGPFAQCSDPIDRNPSAEDFGDRLCNPGETIAHTWIPNVGRPRQMSYDRSTTPGIYHAGAPANDLCWFRYEFKSEIAKLHMLYDQVDIRWGVVVDLV